MKSSLGIGIVPMTSGDNVEVNLANILKQLEFYKDKRTDLIVFPENSLYFNFNKNLLKTDALTLNHVAFHTLADWAKRRKCYLHMGGVPVNDEGTVYNASVLLTPEGERKIIYRKIHLFDVDVNGNVWRESLSVSAGAQPEIIDIRDWKVGLSICYDLRFSELFLHYHRAEVDLILVPSSFIVPTGRAHWHTLLKARAIETQAFVAAAAQGGIHTSDRAELGFKQTWGQSLIFEPWGVELGATASFDELEGEKNTLQTPLWSELDPTLIQKARQQIPLLGHRRL